MLSTSMSVDDLQKRISRASQRNANMKVQLRQVQADVAQLAIDTRSILGTSRFVDAFSGRDGGGGGSEPAEATSVLNEGLHTDYEIKAEFQKLLIEEIDRFDDPEAPLPPAGAKAGATLHTILLLPL